MHTECIHRWAWQALNPSTACNHVVLSMTRNCSPPITTHFLGDTMSEKELAQLLKEFRERLAELKED